MLVLIAVPSMRVKVGAARAMYSLLASSARASRMRAWLRWKQMVVVSVARQRARRAALGRCQRLRILRDKRAAWEALRTRAEKASFIVSGVARLEAALFKSRRCVLAHRIGQRNVRSARFTPPNSPPR